MDEALDGPRHLHRGRDGGRRLRRRDRQRPRHSRRSAPEVQEQVRARSDHVHACTRAASSTPKVYGTSGGLHGVGVSVANALSERMEVEVAREQTLYRMAFERGKPKGKLEKVGRAPNRRGTKVRFRPDPDIFGAKAHFRPERIFKMARSKAYLFGGVEIRWSCAKELLHGVDGRARGGDLPFRRRAQGVSVRGHQRRRRWSIPTSLPAAPARSASTARRNGRSPGPATADGFLSSYCNTIPTAGRRHARIGPAQRAAQGHQGSRRAHGPGQARGSGDRRRRDDRRRLHGLGVHPRAGIPGPDQGPARHRGSDPHRRERDQGPVRPLARRQSRRRRTSCSTS